MKETTSQVLRVAELAEQLHEALRNLTGPSGRMTSWWDGKPSDWPVNLPWSDELVAQAWNATGSLVLQEEED